jgi:hypothetical protein
MPKVRRRKLPPLLLAHIVERARKREISIDHVHELYRWLESNPTVPEGEWFKRFRAFTLCGEGELVKTFLVPGQLPYGDEVF